MENENENALQILQKITQKNPFLSQFSFLVSDHKSKSLNEFQIRSKEKPLGKG